MNMKRHEEFPLSSAFCRERFMKMWATKWRGKYIYSFPQRLKIICLLLAAQRSTLYLCNRLSRMSNDVFLTILSEFRVAWGWCIDGPFSLINNTSYTTQSRWRWKSNHLQNILFYLGHFLFFINLNTERGNQRYYSVRRYTYCMCVGVLCTVDPRPHCIIRLCAIMRLMELMLANSIIYQLIVLTVAGAQHGANCSSKFLVPESIPFAIGMELRSNNPQPITKIYVSSFISFCFSIVFAGMSAEDEWYNKSLSALRMNSSHHPNLSAPMLQYQT